MGERKRVCGSGGLQAGAGGGDVVDAEDGRSAGDGEAMETRHGDVHGARRGGIRPGNARP